MNLKPFLRPHIKNNKKWIIDLNETAKTITFLKENINLSDLGLGKAIFSMTLKANNKR